MTHRVYFSHILRHPARKWSGSILTTLEPARGFQPLAPHSAVSPIRRWW